MRILWVTIEHPEFPGTAAPVWTYLLLQELATRHQITYLPVSDISRESKAVLDRLKIPCLVPIPDKVASAFSARARDAGNARAHRKAGSTFVEAICTPASTAAMLLLSLTVGCRIARKGMQKWGITLGSLNGSDFDLVHCDHSELLTLLDSCLYGAPRSVTVHNVLSNSAYRKWRAIDNPILKLSALINWLCLLLVEQQWLKRADICFAMSDVEKSLITRQTDARVVVAPVAIDNDYYSQDGVPADLPPRSPWLIYTGFIAYPPHHDAVKYFSGYVLPEIRKKYPRAGFLIVGKSPPADIISLGLKDPGIIITGKVPDVRPYLRAADVVVVPMRFGSGVRIKIMEALAMGKPVVSTSVGFEGLNLLPGQHILKADTPAQFAQAVDLILSDQSLRENLGKAGRLYAAEHFDYRPIAKQIESAWSTPAKQTNRPEPAGGGV